MGVSTLLFRGLPATGGIKDPRTRQIVDAIIENLRSSGLRVSSTGAVFAGGAGDSAGTLTPSTLEQLGGGHGLALDFEKHALRLKTLVGVAPVSLEEVGNTIRISATGEATSSYKVKITTGGDPDYLSFKLVSAGGSYPLLFYASDLGNVRGLKDGDGILMETSLDGTEVEITLALYNAEITPPCPLFRVVAGVGEILGLNQGDGILLEILDDAVKIHLGLDEQNAIAEIGKVKIDGDDTTLDYLAAKFEEYAIALAPAGDVADCRAIVLDEDVMGVRSLQLGGAAVADVGTEANQVAAGNHGHAGLLLPDPAADKSIVYAATVAGGWTSETLLAALQALVGGLSTADAEAGDKALVWTGSALKLSEINVCVT